MGAFMDASSAPTDMRRWRIRIAMVLFAAVVVPLGAAFVRAFPPTEYGFYPRCLLFQFAGLHCPGCGATRAVAALLHGDVAQALAYNPLFVLALPLFGWAGGSMAYEAWTGKRAYRVRWPDWSLKLLMVVLIAYWIARNLDLFPLSLLAPHEI